MASRKTAPQPKREVTVTYTGTVALKGTGRPTLADLDEFLTAALNNGADDTAEVNGSISSFPEYDKSGLYTGESRTDVYLSVGVPAGPLE